MKLNTTARNRDFVRRCFEIYEAHLREGVSLTPDELVVIALQSRPRAHYLSFETASKKLHLIERSGIGIVKEAAARAMWTELRSQVDEVMRVRGNLTFSAALSAVLNFGRPTRFYMSEGRARNIIRPYYTRSFILFRKSLNRETRC